MWRTLLQLNMVEGTPLNLEQRLEAARKRYSEIKKKKASLEFANKPNDEVIVADENRSSHELAQVKEENQNLKEQIKELNDTIQQQKITIKRLRDETTELKLDRIDLDDRITELEEQVTKLNTQVHTQPRETVQRHDVLQNKHEDPVDFRERLMKWKNWQPDMRSWNTATKAEV